MFIVQASLQSFLRKPLITILLLVNTSVMAVSLLVILSIVNSERQTYLRNENSYLIALQQFPALETMLAQLEAWEAAYPDASVSLGGAVLKLPLSYGGNQGVYSVAGTGGNRLDLGQAASIALQPGECLLSYPLAARLGGGSPDSLIGEAVLIEDNRFVVTGILDNVDLESAFIAYESLSAIADPIVTTVVVQASSAAVVDVITADLSPYAPKIRERDNVKAQAGLKRELLQYGVVTAALAVFSLVSFLQLFQYKLREDAYRWSVFSLFGARRSHLMGSALLEGFGIVGAGFGLGLPSFLAFKEYVHIPYVSLAFDSAVLAAAGALSLLMFACLAALLPLYIRGRRNILGRLSA